MTYSEIHSMVLAMAEENAGWVRRDRDAMNEGWDPYAYPEDGYLLDGILDRVEIDMDTDEGMDLYSILTDEVADYLGGEF